MRTFLKQAARMLGILALVGFPASAAAEHSQEAIQAFNSGVQLYNNQQFAQAADFFDKAISADGHFAEAYFARAVCHHSLNVDAQALDDVNAAIRSDSGMVEAYGLRGILQYQANQPDAALSDFNYVLTHKPDDAQSLLGRGALLLQRGKIPQAKRDLKAFLRIRPNDDLAPKIREALASLNSAEEASELSTETPAAKTNTTPRTTSRPRAQVNARAAAAAKSLGASLFKPDERVDKANQQFIRGDNVQVTGDAPR